MRPLHQGPKDQNTRYVLHPLNVALLRASWSLLDGMWGLLKGSLGVLCRASILKSGIAMMALGTYLMFEYLDLFGSHWSTARASKYRYAIFPL